MKVKLARINIGIRIYRETVLMIRFADDIIVTAESECGIQRIVDEMDEMLRAVKMKINSAKTKFVSKTQK